MSKRSNIKFGGKGKLGRALIAVNKKSWQSPDDPFTARDLERYPEKYTNAWLKYFNIPEHFIDKKYLMKSKWEQGYKYKDGIKTKPEDVRYDESTLNYVHEYTSGTYKPDQALSTGHYKLSFTNDQAVTSETRPLHYYLTADDVKYAIDNDIGPNFEVSTFGDMEHPCYGPYLIQGKENGPTGIFRVTNQSNPTLLSGSITGHQGLSDTPTFQVLSFNNTGVVEHTLPLYITGLDPTYTYYPNLWLNRKDLISNQHLSVYLNSPPFSGTTAMTGEMTWSSRENCISWPRTVTLNKFISNVGFLFSGSLDNDDGGIQDVYNNKQSIYVTGWERQMLPHTFNEFQFHGKNPPLYIKSGPSSDTLPYTNENYWFVGAPYYFTGSRHYSYNDIKITGSNDLKGFWINTIDSETVAQCKKIDLSNNPNLTWFDFEQEVQFETLTDLNLSGCNLTGQNLGFRAGSKIHRSETVEGLPPGLAFAGKVSAINAPSIRYLNLEGNGLNRTGIRSWLFFLRPIVTLPNNFWKLPRRYKFRIWGRCIWLFKY